jgi:hypothetical protein
MWDKEKAVAYLNTHANIHSLGRCAEYVRKAIEAGGVKVVRQVSAKDYGSSLKALGFVTLIGNLNPVAGDVVIIQPIDGHPHGHMAMFSGNVWISDFKQNHGLYPSPAYRKLKPSFAIYRYPL